MKKIKLVICASAFLLISLLLCGCSDNEIGFIDTLSESYSAKQYIAEGVYGKNKGSYDENGVYNIIGSDAYDVKYTEYSNISNPEDPFRHIVFSGTIGSIAYYEPVDIYIYDGRLFISKNIYEIYERNHRTGTSLDEFNAVYSNINKSALSDVEYIEISDNYLYKDIASGFSGLFKKELRLDCPDIGLCGANIVNNAPLRRYLINGFSEFETGLVSRDGNRYEFTLNKIKGFDTEANLTAYAKENADKVYSEYTIFKDEIMADYNSDKDYNESIFAMDHGLRLKTEETFKNDINTLYENVFKNFDDNRNKAVNSYNQRQLKLTTEKTANGYRNTLSDLSGYPELISQKYIEQNITPSDVEPIRLNNTVTMEELKALYDEMREQINPKIGLTFIRNAWTPYGSDAGYIKDIDINGREFKVTEMPLFDTKYLRKNGTEEYVFFKYIENSGDFNTTALYDENGSIYFPLHGTAEILGENVEWDDVNQQAYVVRGEEKIPMEGVLYKPENWENDMWFFKVRDLEKLGYKVEYAKMQSADHSENMSYKVIVYF